MKLAAKLVFFLVVGMVVIVAVEASISIERDVHNFQDEMQHASKQFGRTLKVLVEDTWRTSGRDRALKLIEDADQEDPLVNVRLVRLDAQAGDSRRPLASGDELTAIRSGSRDAFHEKDANGSRFVCFYEPIDIDPAGQEYLELSLPANAIDAYLRNTVFSASIVSISLLLTSGVLAVGLGYVLVARPLHLLIDKTRRIGEGDLTQPLELNSRDEFTDLAEAINVMAVQIALAQDKLQVEVEGRIAALEQLRHADRLTTVGRLAAGLAHELGTPLNVVLAAAGSILDTSPSESVTSNARTIRNQVNRMTAIIQQILTFARRRNPLKAKTDLLKLVVQTAELLTALARRHKVQIRISDDSARIAANVDEGQIQQVLTNLVTNAIHAMPNGGMIELSVTPIRLRRPDVDGGLVDMGDFARIDVRDEGTGISAENLGRIFDPFFTTKDVGQGTGLGLSIAYGIVVEHGGRIEVESQEEQGTCFSVYLPVCGTRDKVLPATELESISIMAST